jgi:hypothetical protein
VFNKPETLASLQYRARLKEDEIIRLKLEAQDFYLMGNQQKTNAINNIISQEMVKLNILQKIIVVYKNNMAIIALCAANPLGGLRLTKH